jgi:predicted negative regulator of RcsB-dependent stress response
MALANVAWLLAANGKRVLVMDWNLESPGLDRFFHPFVTAGKPDTGGVADLLRAFTVGLADNAGRPVDWYVDLARVRSHAVTLDWEHFPNDGRIDFMAAGRRDNTYAAAVLRTLDWDRFFTAGGDDFIRALREDMAANYDYTLIDSCAGRSDVTDLCTVHLPDAVVACFTLNDQGIQGTFEEAEAVLRTPKRTIRVFPVPARVEQSEQERLNAARAVAAQRFVGQPEHLPEGDRRRYWLDVEIPYQPLYAYEEMLATIGDMPGQRASLLSSYERLTGYLTANDVVALPWADERLRLATRNRFLRTSVVGPDPVVLRCADADAIWAEWITEVLAAVDTDIFDGSDPDVRVPAAARELVVISARSVRTAERYPAGQSGLRQRLGIYVDDVGNLSAFPRKASARLYEQPEHVAIDRLLALVGYAGPRRPTVSLRYPGLPPAVFAVPPANQHFTGRENELRAVRHTLLRKGRSGSLVLLHGWGGIGKTQIAVEYAHRFRNAYDVVWYVVCDPAVFADASLADLAGKVGLTVRPSDNVAEINRAVLRTLTSGEPYRRWLLIFDNAGAVEQIEPFLPSGVGDVLITSRSAAWPDQFGSVGVEVFSRAESIALLRSRVGTLSAPDADEVAEALGDLPIAVAAAGAYLRDTGFEVNQYLRSIEESGPGALSSPAVEQTWDLLLERLETRSRAAIRLLQLCSVMAPEIALQLIYSDEMADMLRPHDPAVADRYMCGSLVQIMNQLALIKLDLSASRLTVHRLLQHVVRQRMTPDDLARTRHEVHLVLVGLRPQEEVDDPDSWPRFQMLWPHLDVSRFAACTDENVRSLMIDRVRYVWRRGTVLQSEREARRILATWHAMLDDLAEEANPVPLRRQILQLSFHLAVILRDLGRFEEARRLDETTYAGQEKLLGGGHPQTLMTASGVAADLQVRGRYREALDQHAITYAAWVERFGEDFPQTMNARIDLGATHRLLGEHREARRHDQEVYYRLRDVAGAARTMLALRTADHLGRDLREAGEYRESVRHLRAVTRSVAEVFGADSSFASVVAVNLAVSLRSTGQADEAAALLQSTYERLVETRGVNDFAALACRLSWSLSLLAVGEPHQARGELSVVHQLYRERLGESHPHTVVALLNLAMVARAERESGRANRLAEQAAAEAARILGSQHPYALAAAMNLAVTVAESGEVASAAAAMTKVCDALDDTLGPEHPDTLRARANLALAQPASSGPAGDNEIIERLSAGLGSGHPAVSAFRDRRYLHRLIDPEPF